MPIIPGSRVVVGNKGHVWTVTKVAGAYCYIEWRGHAKVVPTEAAEKFMTPGSPGRPKKPYVRKSPRDAITQALSECDTPDDLARIAENHYKAPLNHKQLIILARLPNFGMQRMYVGRAIRATIALRQVTLDAVVTP